MEFDKAMMQAIQSIIGGVVMERKRHVALGVIGVPMDNGKEIQVKLTLCAEPTMFTETVYSNDKDIINPSTEVGFGAAPMVTTTSVIEQLKAFEAMNGNDI